MTKNKFINVMTKNKCINLKEKAVFILKSNICNKNDFKKQSVR